MKIALHPNEKLLREGAANLQRGFETVGGKLFLTNQRILFQSHWFNIQQGETEILLASVRGTRLCWTKFLGAIPLLPNSLAVATTEDTEYRFVVSRREQWVSAISSQLEVTDV